MGIHGLLDRITLSELDRDFAIYIGPGPTLRRPTSVNSCPGTRLGSRMYTPTFLCIE